MKMLGANVCALITLFQKCRTNPQQNRNDQSMSSQFRLISGMISFFSGEF